MVFPFFTHVLCEPLFFSYSFSVSISHCLSLSPFNLFFFLSLIATYTTPITFVHCTTFRLHLLLFFSSVFPIQFIHNTFLYGLVCRDNHNLCPSYFPYCRSSKYGSWMRINCAKTCSYCTSKPKPASCQDKNQNCNYWANKGECQKNPGYMLKFCKKSCGRCVKATVKPSE